MVSRTWSVTLRPLSLTNEIDMITESVRECLVKELMSSLLCKEQLLCCVTNPLVGGAGGEMGEW